MKKMPILLLGIVGFFVASVAGATTKNSEPESDPAKDSEESQNANEVSVIETDQGDTQESSSESEPENTGQIFDVHEREVISDPNFNVKKNRADEYFRRGTLLYEGGDYASAAQAFLVAYETLPHQAVLGNIALCFDKAGKIPEAVVYYREYLAKPVESEKNDYMTARLKELETLVGELEVDCRVEPCEIRVDGITRGKEHSEHAVVVLMPGKHRIEAYSGGILVQGKLVEIETRQKSTETLDAEPEIVQEEIVNEPSPIIEPPEVQKNESPLLGPLFWLATGSTIVSAAVAATFGGLVLRKKAQFRDAESNSPNQRELAKDGERLVLVTNIMVGVTGIGLIAAVVLGYRDVKKKKEKKVAPELTLTTSVSELGVSFAFSF